MPSSPKPSVLNDEAIKHVKEFNALRVMRQMAIAVDNSESKEEFLTAIKPFHMEEFTKLFKDESHQSKSVINPSLQKVGELLLILDRLKISFSLDDAVRYGPWQSDISHRLHSLEQVVQRSIAFEAVADRALKSFIIDINKSLAETLRNEREAILTVQTDRHAGHVTGSELRLIGECSSHLRIVANHLNFGVVWDETTGLPVANDPWEFGVMTKRLLQTRWTFILPDHRIPLRTDPAGNLEGHAASSWWRHRVAKFCEHYTNIGGVAEKVWDQNVLFAYSPLPIAMSYILYGLGKEGLGKLRSRHPEIIEMFDDDEGEHWIQTPDGGAFIGVIAPRHGVAKFASLLDRNALLYATRGFKSYWDSTRRDPYPIPHPCIGLPRTLDAEYREELANTSGPLFDGAEVKVPGTRVEVDLDN